MELEIKLHTFYLTSMSAILAMGVILKNDESDLLIKALTLLCLLGVGMYIANDYRKKIAEIEEIFGN